VKGSVDAALIGGVEDVNEMLFSVLDRIGALAASNRQGIVLGEGGAMLVAGSGTRKPYGFLAGFGVARDTTASVSDWGTDHNAVVTAMRAAMDDAEIDSVDAIYVSANGSKRGDALETRALEAMFGASMPPLVATKHLFGEYAAGGALQLIAALLGEERHALVNSISAGGGIICAVVSR
jgi:3-oxoacyl-(acyl-carrier-protein) synthase